MSSTTEKAGKLNSDIYESDFALINEIQKKGDLLSRKEAIHAICDKYRGVEREASEKKLTCEFLSAKSSFCSMNHPKIVKTNAERCDACLKAQKHQRKIFEEEDFVHKMWKRLDAPFGLCDPVAQVLFIRDKLAAKDKEIEELRKPNEALLTEKSNLQTEIQNMKNALVERIEQIAALEMNNTELRMQNEELSKDTLVEKNSFLTVQVAKAQKDVEDLKIEVEKVTALAEMRKQNLNELINQINKMMSDFKRYAPTTADPYEIRQYITKVLQRIENFEQQLHVTN